jgi:hypothetical protein
MRLVSRRKRLPGAHQGNYSLALVSSRIAGRRLAADGHSAAHY